MKNSSSQDVNNRGLISLIIGVAPVLLIVAVSSIFFSKLLSGERILASGDPLLYFYPYWETAAEALRAGLTPLWNPDIFMGAPFLANSQVGFFYPLNWLVWLLFPTPYAYSASAYLHVLIGTFGVYMAARTCLSLSKEAALFSAILFGLGGYFTAQIAHINQVQGMAWLPYFFVVSWRWRSRDDWRRSGKQILSLAVLFALQFFAGHMQAVLVTLVCIFLWETSLYFLMRNQSENNSSDKTPDTLASARILMQRLLPVIIGCIFAVVLASVQLIPTFELIGNSSRQGGLSAKEALSFSLHPLLLSKALLPNCDSPLFIEYVATLPVTSLILVVIGAWRGHRRSSMKALLVVAIGGLALALGIFNPLNQLLVRLPIFNLFRVPARWLLLYAFAMSLLAGGGLEYLLVESKQLQRSKMQMILRPLMAGVVLVVLVILWAVLSVPLSRFIPIGAEATATTPSIKALLFWLLELLGAALLIFLIFSGRLPQKAGILALIALATVALFGGTRILPYNNPTTPEAYSDMRPPALVLQANNTCLKTDDSCLQIEGRFLSLSNIFFDVGDQPEIDTMYADFLSEQALYDLTIATKQKEIIAPNLPMVYGLPSVDGFGGGLLPLQTYSDLTRLILRDGENSTDGRLREYISGIPDHRWLDLFNAKYLITDKVGDRWVNEVFFDMQLPTIVSQESGPVNVGHVQPLESTELWLLTDDNPGAIEITFTDGLERVLRYEVANNGLVRAIFSQPGTPSEIVLFPCGLSTSPEVSCSDPWLLNSLALVDSRDGAFQPLVAGEYRLIHSGDVKIYENLDVLPRAFLVSDWIPVSTNDAALQELRRIGFDPGKSAIINGLDLPIGEDVSAGTAEITSYDPENVSIVVQAENESLLVVTDANYPGWAATIDGGPVPIYDADILFRGVFVPEGKHTVEFTFVSNSYNYGLIVTVAGLVLFLSLAARILISRSREPEPENTTINQRSEVIG